MYTLRGTYYNDTIQERLDNLSYAHLNKIDNRLNHFAEHRSALWYKHSDVFGYITEQIKEIQGWRYIKMHECEAVIAGFSMVRGIPSIDIKMTNGRVERLTYKQVSALSRRDITIGAKGIAKYISSESFGYWHFDISTQ